MILYLIRHGQSVANSAGLVTGTLVDTLAEEGVTQARSLARWINEAGISATRYITSPWQRAQQTADILWPDADWQIDTRVGETFAGDVANWSLDKFVDSMPDFYASNANAYPGGESHLDLNKRVLEWFSEISAAHRNDPTVVLVAHSGPISCILQHVVGVNMESFPAFLPAHASISIVDIPPINSGRAPRLLAFSICPAECMPDSFIGKAC